MTSSTTLATTNWQLKTPVVLIIFKRADTTEQVFAAIRQAKPEKLFVIADGPRANSLDEAQKCAATRAIIERVDWQCEVLTNYADTNMGLKQRVSSGLDWVFSLVEEAIILEDDCVPHPSFFRFCEELLVKYRHDERVMSITGTNLLEEWKSEHQSYHFSYYFNCWGWATWKRVWDSYDVNMELWSKPEIQNRVRDVIADRQQFLNRKKALDDTYIGTTKSWAYQFFFMCLMHSGLCITPAVNLVSNLGFTDEGTNTKSVDKRANLPTNTIDFPLKEPLGFAVDREYDYQRYKKVWEKKFARKIVRKAKRLLATNNFK